MPSIDEFCDRMRYWCDEGNLGYCWDHRWDVREGGEADCSSLVISALREAGFDTGDASYTGDMADELCARGWERVPADGDPSKGAILLNEAHHVAVWLGDCLAQASINERGGVRGGEPGDQNGRETNTRGYYDYPWDFYLVYRGEEEEEDMLTDHQDALLAKIYEQVTGTYDPTGRGVELCDHDHIKWIGKQTADNAAAIKALDAKIDAKLDAVIAKLGA